MVNNPMWYQSKLSRRTMLQLTAGVTGASLLSACVGAPAAPQSSAAGGSAAGAAVDMSSVVPRAAA